MPSFTATGARSLPPMFRTKLSSSLITFRLSSFTEKEAGVAFSASASTMVFSESTAGWPLFSSGGSRPRISAESTASYFAPVILPSCMEPSSRLMPLKLAESAMRLISVLRASTSFWRFSRSTGSS